MVKKAILVLHLTAVVVDTVEAAPELAQVDMEAMAEVAAVDMVLEVAVGALAAEVGDMVVIRKVEEMDTKEEIVEAEEAAAEEVVAEVEAAGKVIGLALNQVVGI